MAKNEGLSCPLCLTANDPVDMLGVTIEHSVPVPRALIGLCKRCVVLIVKSAMSAEFIEPQEIFGDLYAEFTQRAATETSCSHSGAGDVCELCGAVLVGDPSQVSGALQDSPDANGNCTTPWCHLAPGHEGDHESAREPRPRLVD